MSQTLANYIRRQLAELTRAYKQRLTAIAGEYEHLSPEELTRQARHDLDLIAQALETENPSPFLAAIRERTAACMTAGWGAHSTERLLQTLTAIEDTLFPCIDNVQDARFLWQMMRQARSFAAIMPMQRLYDSETKFRQLVDRSPVGIFRTTPEGQIVEANPAFLRIVGYNSLQTINQVGVPGLYQDPGDREQVLALLQKGPVSGYETRFRRADGQTVPVSITARTVDEDKECYLEGIIEDITERKWAEEALRESEERLRIVSDSMPVGIVIIDTQTHVIIDVNPAAVEMIGATREQIIGSLCHNYICPAEQGQCPLTDLGQQVNNSKRALIKAGGASVPVLKTVAPIILDGRECLLESFIDISEREQAEAALRESEERFRSVVENSHTGVLIVNETFQFIYANDQICQILGYPREEIIGMDFRHVLDDESKQVVAERYVRRQRGEQVSPRYDLGIIRKDGQKRQLEMSAIVLKDPDGNVRTVGQVLDITERKRAETALRENEQRYRQLIEEASDVVYTTDAKGYFTYINPPGSKLSGYLQDEIIGTHFTELIPQGWKEQVLSFYQKQFKDRTRKTTLEFPFITKDGEQKWVEQTATLLTGDDSPVGFQSIVRDITERKHLEQEIRESLERRGRQVQTSIEVAQDIAAATALNELFGRVVTLVKQRFGYYHVQIFRYEPQVNAVVLMVGYGDTGAKMLAAGHRLRMGHGVVGTAAATGRSVLANDVTQDPDWVPNPFLPETKGELAVPIVFRQTQSGEPHDQVLGILDVQSNTAGTLTPEDQFLLEGLCGQIAIAIESTRLRQEMEDRLRELDALYRATARKGWKTAQLDTPAYIFDGQSGLSVVPDLWAPPIEEALASGMPAQQEDVVAIPLLLRGEAIGAVGVYDDPQAPLSPEQMAFLQSLTEQATQALESARLFEEARTSAEELSILNEMSRTLSTLLDVETVFENVYHHTSRLMDTSSFYIALYDAETEDISFPLAVEDQQRVQWQSRRLGKGLTEHVIRSREPVLISENIFQWLEQQGIEAIGREAQSWLGVPMTVGDRVIGVIAVQSYTVRRLYDEHQRDLLSAVASQAAIAIQTTRLFQETRSRAEELSVLNDLSQALSATLNVQQVLEETYRGVSRLLDTTNFYIGLYNPQKGEVVFPLNVTESRIDQEITVIPADQGVTGYIIRQRASVLIEKNVNEWLEEMGLEQVGEAATSYLGVPLMMGDRVLGVMAIQSYSTPRLYDEHDQNLLTAIASQAAIAIQNARMFEQTQTRARREHLIREINARVSRSMDLETVLKTTARELSQALGASHAVIRLGTEPVGPSSQEIFRAMPSYLYEQSTDAFASADDLWRPEMEQAIREKQPVVSSAEATPLSQAALAMPITLRGEVIGVLDLYDIAEHRQWSDEEMELISAVMSQAALTIDNARLFDETARRARETTVIQQITALINASEDVMKDLNQIARLVRELAPADLIALASYTPGEPEFTYSIASANFDLSTQPNTQLPLKGSGLEWAIAHGEPSLEADIRQKQSFLEDEQLAAQGLASRLLLPLHIQERVIGTLNLASTKPGAFNKQFLPTLNQIADQMALALERSRLLAETQVALSEVEATHRRYLREEWEDMLTAVKRTWGYLDGPEGLVSADQIWTPEIEQAVLTGEPTIWTDATASAGQGQRNALALPIRLRGQTIGVLDFYHVGEERTWTENDKALVQALADQVALTLETQRLFEQTQRRAFRERVTGEITSKIRAAGDVHSILETAAEELGRVLGVSRTLIRLGNPNGGMEPVSGDDEGKGQNFSP